MFWLIKQVFLVLLSFDEFLKTKCASLNNEPHIARPNLFDLNHVELIYYPFMISLDKYNESYNAINDFIYKIHISSYTKVLNVEVFNMIIR